MQRSRICVLESSMCVFESIDHQLNEQIIVCGDSPVKDAPEEEGSHSRGGAYKIDAEVQQLILKATKPSDITIETRRKIYNAINRDMERPNYMKPEVIAKWNQCRSSTQDKFFFLKEYAKDTSCAKMTISEEHKRTLSLCTLPATQKNCTHLLCFLLPFWGSIVGSMFLAPSSFDTSPCRIIWTHFRQRSLICLKRLFWVWSCINSLPGHVHGRSGWVRASWRARGGLAGGCREGGLMKKIGGPPEFIKCAHAQFHLFHGTVDAYAQ